MQSIALLGVPVYSFAKYGGMGRSVSALRQLGLADALSQSRPVHDLGDVEIPGIKVDTGAANLRNFESFTSASLAIKEAASKIPATDFAFFVGGECGMIVGNLAGLKTNFRGHPGVLWMDSHGDFNTPNTTPSGFIGGMCLAFACGRGPALGSAVESLRPLLTESRLVHIGSRALDRPELEAFESSEAKLYPARLVKEKGVEVVAAEAAQHLMNSSDWILCHLDVDVMDPTIIPAVNYPEKNGLNFDDVKTTVKKLQASGKLMAFDLAAYNPDLDRDGSSGRRIVQLISEIFA